MPEKVTLNPEYKEWRQRIANLEARVSDVESRTLIVENSIDAIANEVSNLGNTTRKPKGDDELTVRILDFLNEYAALRFHSNSIAGNLQVDRLGMVRGRLDTLARHGRIQRFKPANKTPEYQALVVPTSKPAAPPLSEQLADRRPMEWN